MKRVLSVVLCLCLLFSSNAYAFAEGQDGTQLPEETVCTHGVATAEVAATCVSDGNKNVVCDVCGQSMDEVVPATGEHSYGDAVVTEPTCGAVGSEVSTCTVCGDVQSNEIPATGEHDYKDNVCQCGAHICFEGETVYTDPTCTEAGKIIIKCGYAGCDYSDSMDNSEALALGHSFVEHVCSVCGEAEPMMTDTLTEADCTCTNNCVAGVNDSCLYCEASEDKSVCKNAKCIEADNCLAVSGSHNVACVKTVASVGEKGYVTVTDAINAAENGATVVIIKSTDEYIAPWVKDTTHASEKSLTITGANGVVLSGGMYLGYDDSHNNGLSITVQNLNFTGKGVLVAGFANVTISNNTFSDITACVATSGSSTANAISVIGKNVVSTITGNTITNVTGTSGDGINLRDTASANVSGNRISNTVANSITITGNADSGAISITNNSLSAWGKSGEGRAARISCGKVSFTGNDLTSANPNEELVKLPEATAVDFSGNYWDGKNPEDNSVLLLASGVSSNEKATIINSYYNDPGKSELKPTSSIVAQIGKQYFASLEAAVAVVNDGDTITLLKDTTEAVSISGKKCTLDLNGKTVSITGTNSDAVSVVNGAEVTIKNGTLISDGNNCGGVYVKEATANLVDSVFKGTNSVAAVGVYASNGSNITITNCELYGNPNAENSYGLVMLNAKITINSGTFTGKYSVSANGSSDPSYDKAQLVIKKGTFNGGIYWPAQGKLTIEGGEITGDTAVFFKSGSLEITGGTFTGNGARHDYGHVESGSDATGDAIVIENVGGTTGYEPITSVSISGGTFTSVNASAVASYTAGNEGIAAVTGFITGGTFSSDVNSLCAIGYKATEKDGAFTVAIAAANNGTTSFDTVQEAISSTTTGTVTINQNQDLGNEAVEVNAGVTVDLGGKEVSGNITGAGTGANVDLNGGTFTGTVTNANVDLNGGTLDGNVKGTVSVNGGTWEDNVCPTDTAEEAKKDYIFASNDAVFTADGEGITGVTSGTVELLTDLNLNDVEFAPGVELVISEDAELQVTGAITLGTTNVKGDGKIVLYENSASGAALFSRLLRNTVIETTLTTNGKLPDDSVTSGVEGKVVVCTDNGDGTFTYSLAPIVAKIGDTGYASLEDAVDVAGANDIIVLAADVEYIGGLGNAKALNLNGKTLKGNVAGTVIANGFWLAPVGTETDADPDNDGYINMLGTSGAYKFVSTNGTITVLPNGSVSIDVGTVSLGENWRTLPGQTVTVASGASFVVPAGKTFDVRGTVVVNGTADVKGEVVLKAVDATVTAGAGMNITSGVSGYSVVHNGTKYALVLTTSISNGAQVGGVNYTSLNAALAAATDGSTVTLLADCSENIVIDKDVTLNLNGKDITGSVTVEDDAVLTISAADLASMDNGVTVKDASVKVGDRTIGMDNGVLKADNGGKLTATPEELQGEFAMVSYNGVIVLFNNYKSNPLKKVEISSEGIANLPEGSTVKLSSKFSVTADNGGELSKDGVLTQTPEEVSNYGYGKAVITEVGSNGKTTKTGIFAPEGKTLVTKIKDGKVEVSSNAAEKPITNDDGSDKPDLKLDYEKRSFYKYGLSNLQFICNGFRDTLASVKIDGKELKQDIDYSLKTGSTILTLKNSYMKELSLGDHTLTMTYDDGQTVTAKISVVKTPLTGDSSQLGAFTCIMALSAVAMLSILIMLKKRKA